MSAQEDAAWDAALPELSNSMPTLPVMDHHLRCRICKDYLAAPMITTCGHTFCSLCIRRALAAEAQCPACRTREEEFKLRKNVLAEELVEAFKPLRQCLVTWRQQAVKQPLVIFGSSGEEESVPLRAKRRRTTRSGAKSVSPESDQQVFRAGHVACPVCSKPVHEDTINAHVDRCLSGQAEPEPTASRHFAPQVKPRSATPVTEKRIPKLNYAVLTESKLRMELSRLEIPSHGGKALLQRRHTEWLTLWNSNLDAKQPLSRRELLRELGAWEQALGRSTVKLTTEELAELASGRDSGDFEVLKAQARASAAAAKRQALDAAAEEAAGTSVSLPS